MFSGDNGDMCHWPSAASRVGRALCLPKAGGLLRPAFGMNGAHSTRAGPGLGSGGCGGSITASLSGHPSRTPTGHMQMSQLLGNGWQPVSPREEPWGAQRLPSPGGITMSQAPREGGPGLGPPWGQVYNLQDCILKLPPNRLCAPLGLIPTHKGRSAGDSPRSTPDTNSSQNLHGTWKM